MSSANASAPSPQRGRTGPCSENRGGGPTTQATTSNAPLQPSSPLSKPSSSDAVPPEPALALTQVDTPLPTGTGSHSCAYNIPLLENDGSNFNVWKIWMETVLNLHDLWSTVDGMLLRPSHTASLTTRTEWKNKNREARAQIILSLKDKPLDTIIKAETAAECWEKLLECYEGRGVQRKMQLLDEISKTTFTNLDPLEPQINSLLQSARTV
jgi:LTR polyprotein gag-polypeptide-like protein